VVKAEADHRLEHKRTFGKEFMPLGNNDIMVDSIQQVVEMRFADNALLW